MSKIKTYHAHIYFDAATLPQARSLCEVCRDKFGVEMGRVHEKPVGPHPDWSCQLAFPPELFAGVVPWLALEHPDKVGQLVMQCPAGFRPDGSPPPARAV